MNFDFLPDRICNSIKHIDINNIYEIRLRTGYPIILSGSSGIKILKENTLPIVALKCDIDYIIEKITKHSIYAFNDRIKEGFLNYKDGIRIGLAGECVFNNNNILTIKNFSSINIRIPHEIKGCSINVMEKILNKDYLFNTLIISPAGFGKTTLLKDLARELNYMDRFQILIIDERGEFENVKGQNIDKISFSNKYFAFTNGLRSLSPSVVITDELSSKDDWECLNLASNSGVKVIASCHARTVDDVINKRFFIKNVFERYVVIEKIDNLPKIKTIYDENLNII